MRYSHSILLYKIHGPRPKARRGDDFRRGRTSCRRVIGRHPPYASSSIDPGLKHPRGSSRLMFQMRAGMLPPLANASHRKTADAHRSGGRRGGRRRGDDLRPGHPSCRRVLGRDPVIPSDFGTPGCPLSTRRHDNYRTPGCPIKTLGHDDRYAFAYFRSPSCPSWIPLRQCIISTKPPN
jgi:hypothetical protein